MKRIHSTDQSSETIRETISLIVDNTKDRKKKKAFEGLDHFDFTGELQHHEIVNLFVHHSEQFGKEFMDELRRRQKHIEDDDISMYAHKLLNSFQHHDVQRKNHYKHVRKAKEEEETAAPLSLLNVLKRVVNHRDKRLRSSLVLEEILENINDKNMKQEFEKYEIKTDKDGNLNEKDFLHFLLAKPATLRKNFLDDMRGQQKKIENDEKKASAYKMWERFTRAHEKQKINEKKEENGKTQSSQKSNNTSSGSKESSREQPASQSKKSKKKKKKTKEVHLPTEEIRDSTISNPSESTNDSSKSQKPSRTQSISETLETQTTAMEKGAKQLHAPKEKIKNDTVSTPLESSNGLSGSQEHSRTESISDEVSEASDDAQTDDDEVESIQTAFSNFFKSMGISHEKSTRPVSSDIPLIQAKAVTLKHDYNSIPSKSISLESLDIERFHTPTNGSKEIADEKVLEDDKEEENKKLRRDNEELQAQNKQLLEELKKLREIHQKRTETLEQRIQHLEEQNLSLNTTMGTMSKQFWNKKTNLLDLQEIF